MHTFGALFTARISSILDPTNMTFPPLTIPEFLKVTLSLAMPLIMSFWAVCGTPHILSKCAFSSRTVASYANETSCLFLLKTTVNSTCSGISQTSEFSVDSEAHEALSVGASICDFPLSTQGLLSISGFELPFATKEFRS